MRLVRAMLPTYLLLIYHRSCRRQCHLTTALSSLQSRIAVHLRPTPSRHDVTPSATPGRLSPSPVDISKFVPIGPQRTETKYDYEH